MTRPLRRRGRIRSVLAAVRAILWAIVWMVPMGLALRSSPARGMAIMVASIATFVGLYVVRALRSRPRNAAQLRLRPWRPYLPWLTVAAVLKLVFVVSGLTLHEQLAAQRLLPRLPDDPDFVSAEFLAHPLGPVTLFLTIAVLAPLVEEFAFRGRMQHALEHSFGAGPAMVIVAITFSLLHGRIDAIHHLVFGFFAAWVVWRTGSIWTAVYMHAFNNGAAQLLMHLAGDGPVSPSELGSRFWPHAIMLGVLAGAGLFMAAVQINRLAAVERPRLRVRWSKTRPGTVVSPA